MGLLNSILLLGLSGSRGQHIVIFCHIIVLSINLFLERPGVYVRWDQSVGGY